ELVAVAVTLADLARAVHLGREAARRQRTAVRAETHRAALRLHAALIGHQIDDRSGRRGIGLGRGRPRDAAHVAPGLHDRHLHTEADAEERHAVLSRVSDRLDLALGATPAEAAGHQHAVDVRELALDVRRVDRLAVDVLDVDLALVRE